MIIFWIILGLGLGAAIWSVLHKKIQAAHVTPELPTKKRSKAAVKLINQYNALPENHRPNIDIVTAVEALDVKHGINDVDSHFTDWRHSHYFSWTAGVHFRRESARAVCREKDCEFYSYYRLHVAMNDIVKALETQAHELAVAGIQHDLDSLDSVYEELRSETKVIDSVTKDLTGK